MRRHVLVTRPSAQAEELAAPLRSRGMAAVPVPTVEIDTTSTAALLDEMLATLAGAAWLVLTSANGARALASRMAARGIRLPDRLRVAAVGPATAEALRNAGIGVDHVPDTYLTVAVAGGLGEVGGKRVILARADAATPELHDALLARGAVVEEVIAYHTVEGPASSRDSLHAALQRSLDGIAFSSGSTVRGLLHLVSPIDSGRARALPAFCIGPVTAVAARRAGFDIGAVAAQHTAVGLADAIVSYFETEDR